MSAPAVLVETYGAALLRAADRLRAAGVEQSRGDARLLLADAEGCSVEQVFGYPERSLSPAGAQRFEAALARRAAREPVSRILGRREFRGLEFTLGPATLDPRPDSELLVETVAARFADTDEPLSILDLGTGSGCLLLALLAALPKAWGLGIDRARDAATLAAANARRLGLASRAGFVVGDWTEALAGPWKAIVSNPPYIRQDAFADLAPEVRLYEPRAALDGGVDGLSAYRVLVPAAFALLQRGGLVAFEVGEGQAGAVAALFAEAGFAGVGRDRDLAGIERCVFAEKAV